MHKVSDMSRSISFYIDHTLHLLYCIQCHVTAFHAIRREQCSFHVKAALEISGVLGADTASSGAATVAADEATHSGPDWSDCICDELLHALPQAACPCSDTTQELCRGCHVTTATAKDGAEKGLVHAQGSVHTRGHQDFCLLQLCT